MPPSQSTRADRAVLAVFAACCLPVVLGLSALPREGTTQLAVVFPPWTSSAEALTRAAASGARLVSAGRYDFIVIVEADGPGFSTRIREAGALATLDARRLGGCLSAVETIAS